MKKRILTLRPISLISISVVLLDQVSKLWAQIHLQNQNSTILIPYFIKLRLVTNSGAAFSLLSGSTIFLSFLSLGVATIMIIWLWKAKPLRFWEGISFALILGGTIGNGIDRFRIGYVTDFIELIPINFPIFNIADISINIALICLLIDLAKNK